VGEVEVRLGRIEEARAHAETVLRAFPGNEKSVDAESLLVTVEKTGGHYDKARDHAKNALRQAEHLGEHRSKLVILKELVQIDALDGLAVLALGDRNPRGAALHWITISERWEALGNSEQAEAALKTAADVADAHNLTDLRADIRRRLRALRRRRR